MSKERPKHEDVMATLDLEEIEHNVFQGLSPESNWSRIFGGQVIGQSLAAGQKTITDLAARPTHSFNSHFLRPGNPDIPIRYEVENIRDGRSFSTRHIRATQNGKGILLMTASFQDHEEGFEHQTPMPKVPSPEDVEIPADEIARRLKNLPKEMQEHLSRPQPIEMRFVTERDMLNPKPGDPEIDIWFRAAQSLAVPNSSPNNRALHAAVFAYASDMSFMDTALIPHGSSLMDSKVHGVSLDHSVWFHEDINMHDWMLFSRESTWARHGRGYIRGMVFSREGRLLASVTQECLIRKME